MVKRILPIISSIAISSCGHLDVKGILMPTAEGVEKRFEQSAQMNADLKAGSVQAEASYSFYAATDPHINETHRNLDVFNDALRNDGSARFGVILGDCTDVLEKLPTYLEALEWNSERHSFNQEIFHVLGNHDIFFNGWGMFKEQVGPSVYWFEVVFPGGKDLYISLDTATGTLGRKQSEWFKKFLSENRKGYRHCVILTHTNFFYTDRSQNTSGNMPIEESLALIDFLGKQDVTLVLQGHDHFREDLTYDNVRYTLIGALRDEMDEPEFLKVVVNQNNIELDWQLIR